MEETDTTEATVMLSQNQAPRSSLLRRSRPFGYEGRKLQDILRNSPTHVQSHVTGSRCGVYGQRAREAADTATATNERAGPCVELVILRSVLRGITSSSRHLIGLQPTLNFASLP
jgi:hypothetical protein